MFYYACVFVCNLFHIFPVTKTMQTMLMWTILTEKLLA
jgi:hypothetical protein